MSLKQSPLLMAGTGRDTNNVYPEEELTVNYRINIEAEHLSDQDQSRDK